MKKIKAVVLDIDGVIVGDREGVNWPDPHPAVIENLRSLRESGMPVVLCTAKPHYSIGSIIRKARLNNYHVTDGGALIIDPISGSIVSGHFIDPALAADVIAIFHTANTYLEFYTPDAYYAEKSIENDITRIHENILQTAPRLVAHLPDGITARQITKIMPIARNSDEKNKLTSLFEKFKDTLTLVWSKHPVAYELDFGIITKIGVSKERGSMEALAGSGVSIRQALGVGDSTSDWIFMKSCGYAAAMGNATADLKKLVSARGRRGYIGPGVDENGIIDILRHFSLLNFT